MATLVTSEILRTLAITGNGFIFCKLPTKAGIDPDTLKYTKTGFIWWSIGGVNTPPPVIAGHIKSICGVDWAHIKKFAGVEQANIKKASGVES